MGKNKCTQAKAGLVVIKLAEGRVYCVTIMKDFCHARPIPFLSKQMVGAAAAKKTGNNVIAI